MLTVLDHLQVHTAHARANRSIQSLSRPLAGPVTKCRLFVSALALDATLLAAMLAVVAAGPVADSIVVRYHSAIVIRSSLPPTTRYRHAAMTCAARSGEPYDGWPLVVKILQDHAKADCSEAQQTPGPLIAPSANDNSSYLPVNASPRRGVLAACRRRRLEGFAAGDAPRSVARCTATVRAPCPAGHDPYNPESQIPFRPASTSPRRSSARARESCLRR